MAKTWVDAGDTVGKIASSLIPNYHPELATARMNYVFVDKASKKGGRPILGRAKKISGFLEWVIESDFLIEIALDEWNNLSEHQRVALVDHMLEYCTGVEDEKNGAMKWTSREPDVQEFSTILDRYGAWNQTLAGFVSVAKRVQLDEEEETAGDEEEETLNDSETE